MGTKRPEMWNFLVQIAIVGDFDWLPQLTVWFFLPPSPVFKWYMYVLRREIGEYQKDVDSPRNLFSVFIQW